MNDWGQILAAAAIEPRPWWEVWQVPGAISAAIVAATLAGLGVAIRALWKRRATVHRVAMGWGRSVASLMPVSRRRHRALRQELDEARRVQLELRSVLQQPRVDARSTSTSSSSRSHVDSTGPGAVRAGWGSRRIDNPPWRLYDDDSHLMLEYLGERAPTSIELEFVGAHKMPEHSLAGSFGYPTELTFMGEPGQWADQLLVRWQTEQPFASEALLDLPGRSPASHRR